MENKTIINKKQLLTELCANLESDMNILDKGRGGYKVYKVEFSIFSLPDPYIPKDRYYTGRLRINNKNIVVMRFCDSNKKYTLDEIEEHLSSQILGHIFTFGVMSIKQTLIE